MNQRASNPAATAALGSAAAHDLLAIANAQGLPFGHEYSTKLGAGQMGIDRHLFTLPREAFGDAPDHLLDLLRSRLELPQAWHKQIEQGWARCTHVHLGVEAKDSERVWKVYLESADGFLDRLGQTGTGWRRIHWGYKWTPAQPETWVVSQYDALIEPGLATRNACIEEVLCKQPHLLHAFYGLLRAIPSSADDFMLLRVSDEDTQRLSVDVNLYPASLSIGSTAPWLRQLAACCSVNPSDFEPWLERYGSLELGHIAAGTDAKGQPFATIYCGMAEWRE